MKVRIFTAESPEVLEGKIDLALRQTGFNVLHISYAMDLTGKMTGGKETYSVIILYKTK